VQLRGKGVRFSYARTGEQFEHDGVRAGGSHGRGRGMSAIESWRRVASDVRGGVAENCGHWIPEKRPDWVVEQLLAFFGEEPA
jgi:pimeloyl-ACP methyl ester carboxylesterase